MELFSITGHHRNTNLLRYIPENRSRPRVVTGMSIEKLKIYYKAQNKTWTNPQSKNLKRAKNTD